MMLPLRARRDSASIRYVVVCYDVTITWLHVGHTRGSAARDEDADDETPYAGVIAPCYDVSAYFRRHFHAAATLMLMRDMPCCHAIIFCRRHVVTLLRATAMLYFLLSRLLFLRLIFFIAAIGMSRVILLRRYLMLFVTL